MLRVDRKFNIIVTTPRNREWYAIEEMKSIVNYLKLCKEIELWKSGISGVVLGYIDCSTRELIKKLRTFLNERPWEFRDIKRVIPIDIVVDTSYDDISRVCWEFGKSIPADSSFKINVRKRYTELSSRKLISLAAERIDKKVNLETPDYIINIEILGPKTGISLIKPDEILSVEKELLK